MLYKDDWAKELAGAKAALEAHSKGKDIMTEMVIYFEAKVAASEDKPEPKTTQ